MANKNIKALAIKVHTKTEPQGVEFAWDKIPQLEVFTKNIIIPEIAVDKDGNTSVDIGSIVSGMPTVYARANLFRNALDSIKDKEADASGLMLFYKSLISEWKGLISCIALNYKDIHIERVHLVYSDGKKLNDTANIYEPKGAFGNVLFQRQELWCDQSLANNADKVPFIDVILFNDNVVGGTSPDSFLFSSVSYKIKDKYPYVNVNNGKFIDPLQSELKSEELFAIYGYAKHILNNIEKFRQNFDGVAEYLKPNYGNLYGCIQNWMSEMVKYQEAKGYSKIEKQNPPEVGSLFNNPFSSLFNYSTELYGSEGTIALDANLEGSIPFDPKDLLLPDNTEIAQIDFGKEGVETKNYLKSKPILLLSAETKGQPNSYAYFTLPFTPLALNVFGKNLNALLGLDESSSVKSRVSAVYDPNDKDGEKLIVQLKLFTQAGNEITKQIVYNVNRVSIIGQDILMWPNFISKQWNRYFLFSEIPHNHPKFQATPFVGDVNDDFFRIVLDEKGVPLYLANNGKAISLTERFSNIEAKLHITSNNAVADNLYKYEIYESNQPFKGLKFAHAGTDCGFAIIRYSTINEANLPSNLLKDNFSLKEANLGFDFGSTNSSIAYYSQSDGKIKPDIRLKNRRISLLSSDQKNNDIRPAVEDEIFFFQNDEIRTNEIKSVLTIHDPKRIVKNSDIQSVESAVAMTIKGGFPCFERNLPIESATENRYKLSYSRVGTAELVHNMKWSTLEIENSYKKAYLSSVLLHIYAQLFEEGHLPVYLKWSYPSSMSTFLVGKYQSIWDSLVSVNPIRDGKSLAIAKAPVNTTAASENIFQNANQNASWGASTPVQSNVWGSTFGSESESLNPSHQLDSGWGSEQQVLPKFREIKIEKAPIRFNFQKLSDNKALTEAAAVANYLANNQSLDKSDSFLTLCFDVGGSTTDISALCMMMGNEGPSLALVKQSSIRFAAQRISFATKFSPNFKSVLLEICERKKILIQGLNVKPEKYCTETAPYYFEQIVDRLKDEDFPVFYQLLRAKCPEMMCVNLYVTGLIMYYAGQIAFKLRNEIVNSPDRHPEHNDWKPIINIVFAGKGARIFEWFSAVDKDEANKYYTNLFIQGFGGIEKAKANLFPGGYNGGPPIIINPTNSSDSSNVKYEVAKGLAYPTQSLLVPQTDDAIEILGEEGFTILTSQGQKIPVPYDSSITSEMMEVLGTYFNSTPIPGQVPCPKFAEFASTYFQVATDMFGLKMTRQDFMNGFQTMNINAYIKSLPEYRLAAENKDAEKFDFIAPIIILEGMKFLEEHLLKGIQR